MARVAVVGVGAIGATVAAAAHDAGHDLVLCARRRVERVVVERAERGETVLEGPVLTEPSAIEEPVEWIVLAVKAHQTKGAAGWLSALCTPESTVAVLQNGIDHHERVAPLAGGATGLPVVNWCAAEAVAPGLVRQRTALALTVPAGEAGAAFAALLGDHAEVSMGDGFAAEAWRKLCVNAVSGLMALAGRPAAIFALADV